MSASIEIVGINQGKLLESLPEDFIAVKEKYLGSPENITVEELTSIYDALFFESPDQPESGFSLLFENWTNRTSFLLAQMMGYYFRNFDWKNDIQLEKYEYNYLLNRNQALGLADWYLALALTSRNEEQDNMPYRKEARYIIDDYYKATAGDKYDEYIEFWDFYKEQFDNLISRVQEGNFDYYFYSYFS
ncbi:MAG: hypothetical protein JO154_26450 [Chitinophaga sp.]|uniref:hypothetical protein n=1 Tax=Chitinophaga sp. TaxID=1869181 RepID=UPI0025BC699A|nr:hypothetical protein [Chitinophaga sp.]MBV8256163.1 hypothetical protein [Chitinophaga sp.]